MTPLVPSPAASAAGAARPPLRVAFLSGIRHGPYLMAAFAANPAVRLVALADEPDLPERWERANQQLAERYGLPYHHDLDAVLGRPEIDAVCVASEYVRHGRLALAALAAGKHLFLDKPMATTLAECRAIAQAARQAAAQGVRVLTFSRYTAVAVQRALTLIQAGRIGRVRALSAWFVASYGPGERYDPATDVNWRPEHTGGGELVNFLLYPVTNIRLLAGQEIETVQCFGGALFNRAHRELGIEDMATLILGMSGGVVATVIVGRCHTPLHPTQGDVRVTVTGSAGLVEVNENYPVAAVFGEPKVGVVYRSLADEAMVIQGAVDRFVGWAREGIAPGQTIDDSLRVMETVFAAEEALRTRQVIRLDQWRQPIGDRGATSWQPTRQPSGGGQTAATS